MWKKNIFEGILDPSSGEWAKSLRLSAFSTINRKYSTFLVKGKAKLQLVAIFHA